MPAADSILRELSQLLAERKRTRPADSYTTKLLDAGLAEDRRQDYRRGRRSDRSGRPSPAPPARNTRPKKRPT